MGIVLVHGGTFAASCWDPMVPHLQTPSLAVDLPGRGGQPGDPDAPTLDDFTAAVVDAIDATGWDRVLLVGHSMAGLTLPRVADARPDVLAGLVFVSCTVPAHGQTCVEATAAEVREELDRSEEAGADGSEAPGEDFFRRIFGNDLDDEGFAEMMSYMCGEALAVIEEPMDLSGLRHPIPRTWVRLARDGICTPARQDVFIANLGGAEVIELDAGHMAMFSRPAELAAILDDVADRLGVA